jgi:hypothetical protein
MRAISQNLSKQTFRGAQEQSLWDAAKSFRQAAPGVVVGMYLN